MLGELVRVWMLDGMLVLRVHWHLMVVGQFLLTVNHFGIWHFLLRHWLETKVLYYNTMTLRWVDAIEIVTGPGLEKDKLKKALL